MKQNELLESLTQRKTKIHKHMINYTSFKGKLFDTEIQRKKLLNDMQDPLLIQHLNHSRDLQLKDLPIATDEQKVIGITKLSDEQTKLLNLLTSLYDAVQKEQPDPNQIKQLLLNLQQSCIEFKCNPSITLQLIFMTFIISFLIGCLIGTIILVPALAFLLPPLLTLNLALAPLIIIISSLAIVAIPGIPLGIACATLAYAYEDYRIKNVKPHLEPLKLYEENEINPKGFFSNTYNKDRAEITMELHQIELETKDFLTKSIK
jgi:hypothetical protein